MKFGQLIENSKINSFFKGYAENGAGKLVTDRVLHFLKSFILGKSKWPAA